MHNFLSLLMFIFVVFIDIWINLFLIQIFKPERFEAWGSGDISDTYAFVPFSAGPR